MGHVQKILARELWTGMVIMVGDKPYRVIRVFLPGELRTVTVTLEPDFQPKGDLPFTLTLAAQTDITVWVNYNGSISQHSG